MTGRIPSVRQEYTPAVRLGEIQPRAEQMFVSSNWAELWYPKIMEVILFTLVAVVLYFFSDWLLQRVETRLGRRLEHRTLVFFGIILTLALISFSLIEQLGSAA